MIRNATPTDIPVLKQLWKQCFPDDTDGDIALFFRCRFADAAPLVYEADGQVCSMMYRLPCTFEGQKAIYLYALGTAPQHRGKGYMGSLIRYAHQQMIADGVTYSLLLEGEESLCQYYASFGYQRSFCYKLAHLSGQNGVSVLTATVPYVQKIRSRRLHHAVQWDSKALTYANQFGSDGGERWFKVDDGYAIASLREGKTYISELVCTDMIRAVQAVNTYFGVNDAIVKLPPDMTIGQTVYRGMLYAANGEIIRDAYIAMTLE